MRRRIFVIDDDTARRQVTVAQLRAAAFLVRSAASLSEALPRAARFQPDIALLSPALCGPSGRTACAMLREIPGLSGLPVLTLLRDTSNCARLDALLAGADDVVPPGEEDRLLLPLIGNQLRQRSRPHHLPPPGQAGSFSHFCTAPAELSQPATITLVTPHRALSQRWQRDLAPLTQPHLLQPVTRGALFHLDSSATDVMLLSGEERRSGEGTALLADLLSRRRPGDAPILWVEPRRGGQDLRNALQLGAEGVLPWNFSPAEAAVRLRRLIRDRRLQSAWMQFLHDGLRLALTDPLTGLSNRRHALPALESLLSSPGREAPRCAVMLLDIDHFKRVNDRLGHTAGDIVLTEVARRLHSTLSEEDLIARYGGEEFLIATSLPAGRDPVLLADRLRGSLSDTPIRLPGESEALTITASIGLAACPPLPADSQILLRAADEALLRAKRQGRNQVRLARPLAA